MQNGNALVQENLTIIFLLKTINLNIFKMLAKPILLDRNSFSRLIKVEDNYSSQKKRKYENVR